MSTAAIILGINVSPPYLPASLSTQLIFTLLTPPYAAARLSFWKKTKLIFLLYRNPLMVFHPCLDEIQIPFEQWGSIGSGPWISLQVPLTQYFMKKISKQAAERTKLLYSDYPWAHLGFIIKTLQSILSYCYPFTLSSALPLIILGFGAFWRHYRLHPHFQILVPYSPVIAISLYLDYVSWFWISGLLCPLSLLPKTPLALDNVDLILQFVT